MVLSKNDCIANITNAVARHIPWYHQWFALTFLKGYHLDLIFWRTWNLAHQWKQSASLKPYICTCSWQLRHKNQSGDHILKTVFSKSGFLSYHVDTDVGMWVVESTQGPQVVEHGWVRVGPAADQKPNLYSVVESHTSQSIVNGWPVSRENKVGGEKRIFEMTL